MTVIPEAYQRYFVDHPQERTLAQNLGEAFDVTYGDRVGPLSFWFAHPQEHTCERFGLRDEVLVLYSEHGNIDGRVLRAIRNIQADKRFEHRLDPILVLLVHRGDPERTVDFLRPARPPRRIFCQTPRHVLTLTLVTLPVLYITITCNKQMGTTLSCVFGSP